MRTQFSFISHAAFWLRLAPKLHISTFAQGAAFTGCGSLKVKVPKDGNAEFNQGNDSSEKRVSELEPTIRKPSSN